MSPIEVHDLHTTFWGLAALAFPQSNAEEHITPHPSAAHGVSLPPNLHFVCYDYLYYVGAQKVRLSFQIYISFNFDKHRCLNRLSNLIEIIVLGGDSLLCT